MKRSGFSALRYVPFAVACALSVLLLSACSSPPVVTPPSKSVAPPAMWDLATPQSAVRSYLDWTTFAYRMVNSEAATKTMSSEEEVRVNSYVQLNKESNKLINQKLVSLGFGEISKEATKATVPTRESWEYSYLAIDTLKSLSPTYTISYETTYTVVSPANGVWVVDRVEAKPLGEVK